MEKSMCRTKEYCIAEIEAARQHREERMSSLRQSIVRFQTFPASTSRTEIVGILDMLFAEIEELHKLIPVDAKRGLRSK